jgi:hypothetical protein
MWEGHQLAHAARTLTATNVLDSTIGDKTWPSVYSLERDKDPVIALNAIATGALAACAYLRFIFKSRDPEQADGAADQTPTHIKNLRQLVNAPWHKADFSSFPGCHLLILQGFVSSLLHYRPVSSGSDKEVSLTSFHVVWETLPRILSMASLGDSDRQSRESFLALWAELENLPGTEHVVDADDVPPIVRLMSLLRPTLESIRVQQARSKRTLERFRAAARTIARTRLVPASSLVEQSVFESPASHQSGPAPT